MACYDLSTVVFVAGELAETKPEIVGLVLGGRQPEEDAEVGRKMEEPGTPNIKA
jgi:hypothetical protein